jgi:hypothetical protein
MRNIRTASNVYIYIYPIVIISKKNALYTNNTQAKITQAENQPPHVLKVVINKPET